MLPDDPNVTADPGTDSGRALGSGARSTVMPHAAAAAPQGAVSDLRDLGSDIGPGDENLAQEVSSESPSQLGERGVDLGSLLTAVLASSSQTKPKPAAGQAAAGKGENPTVLLGKLAESLGISPAELLKRLGPVLKEMLSGQGTTAAPKRRRKSKKDGTKPAAKPKPKGDAAKPTAKPKPKSKPKSSASSKPRPKKKTT